ncbi:uncharacterized protein LOC129578464 [Sitodiplosis mosellana]|uniref:uncharacterized protein LOC129578464 n=1 Tax=Sitodiplosis mosellana TaxID=263140 RepID=UPI002444ED48|nr:uncharacterized protein LOC129578464 [Sitodiplosis mosellana]
MDYPSEGDTEITSADARNMLFESFVIRFNEWRAAKINTTMHIHTVDILSFYSFNNTVSIPVIPNTVDDTLKQQILEICGRKEPLYPAVIAKGRGLFIWGDGLEQTMRA